MHDLTCYSESEQDNRMLVDLSSTMRPSYGHLHHISREDIELLRRGTDPMALKSFRVATLAAIFMLISSSICSGEAKEENCHIVRLARAFLV